MTYLVKTGQFLALGIFLFTPHFSVFGIRLKGIYILCILAAVVLVDKRYVDRRMAIFIYCISLLMGVSFALNVTVSLEAVRQCLIFLILFLAFEAIGGPYCKNYDSSLTLVLFIKIWLTLQSLIILASAFLDGFASDFHSIFLLTEKAERYIGDYVLVNRFSGFAPSGFSLLSVYMALLVILVNEITVKEQKTFMHYLFVLIVLLSLIFVGRSGLYYFILYLCLSGTLLKSRFYIFILFFIFIISINLGDNSQVLINYLDFAFELFLNGFSTYSTDTLIKDEIFLPQFSVWGSGELIRTEGGANSDIGWIKLLACFGYIGVFVYCVLFLYMMSHGFTARIYKSSVFVYLFLAFFIFNLKDLYFLSSGYIQVFIIMYFIDRIQTRLNHA